MLTHLYKLKVTHWVYTEALMFPQVQAKSVTDTLPRY